MKLIANTLCFTAAVVIVAITLPIWAIALLSDMSLQRTEPIDFKDYV